MLEIIRRPVYKQLFKSNRMLHVDQKSDVNKTCQQSLFSPIYMSLHQDLMRSGCRGTTVSLVCLQAPTLSLSSPHDFFTHSPYREPAHRLKPFRTFNCFSNSYLQPQHATCKLHPPSGQHSYRVIHVSEFFLLFCFRLILPLPKKHLALVIFLPLPGKHISLVICVPLPRKHISLVLCVFYLQ